MKRLALIFGLFASTVLAQTTPGPATYVQIRTAPTVGAACTSNQTVWVPSTRRTYCCPSGVWAACDAPADCAANPPVGACNSGQTCVRTDTGALYVCQSSVWVASAPESSGTSGTVQASNGGGGFSTSLSSMDASSSGLAINLPGGASTDAKLNSGAITGQTASGTRTCWDLGSPTDTTPDGTCDVFFDPALGLIGPNGLPRSNGRVAIITTSADLHRVDTGCDAINGKCGDGFTSLDYDTTNNSELSAWAINEAATYGWAVGWPSQSASYCAGASPCPPGCVSGDINGDGTTDCYMGLQREGIQKALSSGQSVGTHSASHCGLALDSDIVSPDRTLAGSGTYTGGGTITVTEGSTTVTGSGTNFVMICGGSGDTGAPIGGTLLLDRNADGTYDWQSEITGVTSTTALTIKEALPTDWDGDGTTSEAYAALPVVIRSEHAQIRRELRDTCNDLVSRANTSGYSCRWASHPGDDPGGDYYPAVLAGLGMDREASINHPGPGIQTASGWGATFEAPRVTVTCGWTPTGVINFFQRVIADKSHVDLFFHTPQAAISSCTSGSAENVTILRTVFTQMAVECRACMRAGTCVCTTPEIAAQLDRQFDLADPPGRNLLRNPDMRVATGIESLAAENTYPTGAWPWWHNNNANVDFDSTSNITYDGTADETTMALKNGAFTPLQSVRLRTGFYQFLGAFRTSGLNRLRNAYRICISPMGTYTSGNYLNLALGTIWFVSPVADSAGGFGDANYPSTNGCSQYQLGDLIDRDLDGTISDDQGVSVVNERQIFARLRVPPELDGLLVNVSIDVNTSTPAFDTIGDGTDNDADGTIDETTDKIIFRDLAFVSYVPHESGATAVGTSAGHGVIPNIRFSGISQVAPSATAGPSRPPFINLWNPTGQATTYDVNTVGAPAYETWQTVNAAGGLRTIAQLTPWGRLNLDDGICMWDPANTGDPRSNGSGGNCIANNGTGLYNDKNRDGVKNAGEKYIGDKFSVCGDVSMDPPDVGGDTTSVESTGTLTGVTTTMQCSMSGAATIWADDLIPEQPRASAIDTVAMRWYCNGAAACNTIGAQPVRICCIEP